MAQTSQSAQHADPKTPAEPDKHAEKAADPGPALMRVLAAIDADARASFGGAGGEPGDGLHAILSAAGSQLLGVPRKGPPR